MRLKRLEIKSQVEDGVGCSGCPHRKLKKDCVHCKPCAHGKVKKNCVECSGCPPRRATRGDRE